MAEMTRAKRKKIRAKFFGACRTITKLVDKHVGSDNYAGNSSLAQLGRIIEKFSDCFPLDEDDNLESIVAELATERRKKNG